MYVCMHVCMYVCMYECMQFSVLYLLLELELEVCDFSGVSFAWARERFELCRCRYSSYITFAANLP